MVFFCFWGWWSASSEPCQPQITDLSAISKEQDSLPDALGDSLAPSGDQAEEVAEVAAPLPGENLRRRAVVHHLPVRLRAPRHLLQLLPKPALPKMPGQCPRPLAPGAAARPLTYPLCPRGLHAAASTGSTGLAEQDRDLQPAKIGRASCRG